MSKVNYFIALIILAIAGHLLAFKLVHPPAQMEFVIIFSAVLFYPCLRYPLLGTYILFTILPFVPYVRRLYYLIYERPNIDPLIAIGYILIGFIIIGLFFELRDRQGKDQDIKGFTTAIFLYFAYLLFRTFVFNSMNAQSAVMKFGIYGPPVLMFFTGILFAKKLDSLKVIWIVTLILAIVAGFYGFKQLYFGYSEAERIWFNSISFTTLFIKGIARPFSIFQSPAAFADYMLLGIISIIILYSWFTSAGKHFILLVLPVCFYGALITSVRSNWIGIILCLLLWVTIMRFRSSIHRIIVIVVIFGAFGLYSFIDASKETGFNPSRLIGIATGGKFNQSYINLLVTERASAISNPFEEHSLLSRIALWQYLFNSAKYEPEMAVLGRGLGTLNADSLYITYLAEFGYPGMIFIVLIVILFIWQGFKLVDKTKNHKIAALAKGITIMNISFATINITGTHIHSFPGDIYFWFWNGVLIRLAPMDENEIEEITHAPFIDTGLST